MEAWRLQVVERISGEDQGMAEQKPEVTWHETFFGKHLEEEFVSLWHEVFFDGFETYEDYVKYGDMFSTPESRLRDRAQAKVTPTSNQLTQGEKRIDGIW
jgi:hypothetical protein